MTSQCAALGGPPDCSRVPPQSSKVPLNRQQRGARSPPTPHDGVPGVPPQHHSLRAQVSGGSADDKDHGSQHLFLQQCLAQQRVDALCRQPEGRDTLELAGQREEAGTAPCPSPPPSRGSGARSARGCRRAAAAAPAAGSRSAQSPGSACSPLPACPSSPASTLHGSLQGHGQQAGHHSPVVVPAALRVLLALQGHAVQALAHGDHVLGVPSLTPCKAQSPPHRTATAPTPTPCPACAGIPGQSSPPYSPAGSQPTLGSLYRPHSLPARIGKGGSSRPDALCGAACRRLCYLSAPSGDAAAARGRSRSGCWCGWTQLPGPAGSGAAGSGGHRGSPPLALQRKHTSEGCWGDSRPPHPKTFRV